MQRNHRCPLGPEADILPQFGEKNDYTTPFLQTDGAACIEPLIQVQVNAAIGSEAVHHELRALGIAAAVPGCQF